MKKTKKRSGWWSGFFVGLAFALLIITAIFCFTYLNSDITGNLVLDVLKNKNVVKAVSPQQPLSINCYNKANNQADQSNFKCFIQLEGKQASTPVELNFYQTPNKVGMGDPIPPTNGENVKMGDPIPPPR